MPVHAANGMADMMSLMMEMFLWMMRGGGGGGYNPYGMGAPGGIGNPMLAGSMMGNPLLNNSLMGGSLLSNPGLSPYANPYSTPYSSPYGNSYGAPNYGNSYYNQPYYQQAYNNPFGPYVYNSYSPYSGRYDRRPYRRRGEYNNGTTRSKSAEQTAPVVIQPIIVNPSQQATNQPGTSELYQNPVGAAVPSVPLPAEIPNPLPENVYHNYDPPRYSDNPLYGQWQGVNGENMELGNNRFRLQSGDTDLQGSYQLKNGILKAEIPGRAEPVYMQYRLTEGYLMFESEDGQKMLFRRQP